MIYTWARTSRGVVHSPGVHQACMLWQEVMLEMMQPIRVCGEVSDGCGVCVGSEGWNYQDAEGYDGVPELHVAFEAAH